ncbi:MAG: hypothetical protein Q4G65_02055 [bacterium]|nr:hypothetical protein [bacterium]
MRDKTILQRILTVVTVVISLFCCATEFPWYVGASGGMLLPGNGNSLRRAGEVSARVGCYTSDFLAWEVEGLSAPNASSRMGHCSLSGAAVHGLYHLSGFEAFDKLFGCERFDPFVTLGVMSRFGSRHVFAGGGHRTSTGPVAGIGAFYHLTESLDLRFDARAMLGIDSPCGMLYSAVVGLQWNFGGGGE